MKIIAGILFSMLFIFYSCGLTGGETTAPAAGIYIINASPDASISVTANSSTLVSNYTFNQDSGYFLLPPGTYPFKISVRGTETDSSNTLMNFPAGKYYSLFFIDSTTKLTTLFIEDKFSGDTLGYAKIRIFNFCKSSPSLKSIFANKDTASLTDTIISSRTFNDQGTSPNFSAIIPGTYNLSVYKTDTLVLIKNFGDYSFSANKYYTLYLNGVYTNTTLPLGVKEIKHN